MFLNSLAFLVAFFSISHQSLHTRSVENNLCSTKVLLKTNGHIVPTTSRTIKIFTNTKYEVFCSTNEEVRRTSLLSITRIKTNRSTILSQQTEFSSDSTNVNGILEINDLTSYKEFFNLYCRFLPVNPKKYCETKLRLIAVPSISNRFNHILILFAILFCVITIGFALKLYLKYQHNLTSDSRSNSTLSYVSFHNYVSKDLFNWDKITRF